MRDSPSIASAAIRRTGLRSLGALTKHPFANVGRALEELNALVFTANQELNHSEVHQCDLAQVQDFASAVAIHLRLNAGDLVRLNSPAQPQFGHASTVIFFNS